VGKHVFQLKFVEKTAKEAKTNGTRIKSPADKERKNKNDHNAQGATNKKDNIRRHKQKKQCTISTVERDQWANSTAAKGFPQG
ncbi:hypothetical protein DPMN_145780, partial [Dreissena polymorpha]